MTPRRDHAGYIAAACAVLLLTANVWIGWWPR